ncbi:hypothetical protein DSCO28_43810 [Desulfosarcina ovata subsp. sediminis]|uniref:Ubiquitin Mut7-C domain-containing protein n=1 Tax=Desulfosarcina ovata subsp. sediminis TaxID=885957 RepID=A0A5K7ZUA6_9BACT|nr:hypothetical protein DSCO28_43810 [Desulfosarcina ovata subsp. sediminis]
MKIRVRLYGTLGNDIPDYDRLTGKRVVLPDGSKVSDLIAHLSIPPGKVGIITVDGNLAKAFDTLFEGNYVCMYHPIAGG